MVKPHHPRKRFGQNFLHDTHIIEQIITAINPLPADAMVEIGPGMGAITEPLLTKVNNLSVIELDKDLANSLRIRIGANANTGLQIIQADALRYDFGQLYHNQPETQRQKLRIVGNLPYNISTPLLFHLISYSHVIQDMFFMLQKEVVDRITAEPNSKTYGRLSVMMQYYCQCCYLLTVPNGAFNPPPKVTSAVFSLQPYRNKPLQADNEAMLHTVVRDAFNHRRKTLRAIFKGKLNENQLIDAGLDPMARPETLTLQQFINLANHTNTVANRFDINKN